MAGGVTVLAQGSSFNSTSVTIGTFTAPASGDLMILSIAGEDNFPSSISGWTSAATDGSYCRIFYKISNGTETSIVLSGVVTNGDSDWPFTWLLLKVTGVDTAGGFSFTSDTDSYAVFDAGSTKRFLVGVTSGLTTTTSPSLSSHKFLSGVTDLSPALGSNVYSVPFTGAYAGVYFGHAYAYDKDTVGSGSVVNSYNATWDNLLSTDLIGLFLFNESATAVTGTGVINATGTLTSTGSDTKSGTGVINATGTVTCTSNKDASGTSVINNLGWSLTSTGIGSNVDKTATLVITFSDAVLVIAGNKNTSGTGSITEVTNVTCAVGPAKSGSGFFTAICPLTSFGTKDGKGTGLILDTWTITSVGLKSTGNVFVWDGSSLITANLTVKNNIGGEDPIAFSIS